MRRPPLNAVLALALVGATSLVVVLVRRLDALSMAYSRVRTLASTLHGGSVVPAFQTTTITGDSVTVGESADTNARQVVLVLTTSCPYCIATLPTWARMAVSLQKPGVTRVHVIALSLDSLDKSRRYAEEHQLRYPMATFPTTKLKRLYRANLVPTTAVLDHDGRVLYAHVGLLDNAAVLDSLYFAARAPMRTPRLVAGALPVAPPDR